MLPDLSLLLGLVLGLSLFQGAEGADPDPIRAAGGTAAVLLVAAALSRLAADRAVRALEEGEPEEALAASGRMVLLPLLGWLAVLLLFDWAFFVAATIPKTWFLVPYVALFLPLFVLFAIAWTAARRVEARIVPTAPTAWGAVRRGLRRNLLVLAPLFALLALSDLMTQFEEWGVPGVRTLRTWQTAYPDVASAFTLLLLFALAIAAPSLFRRAMKATPLEPGVLRRALEALAQKLGISCKDFLLWSTNGRVVNAMVVGVTRGTRYVFLTDGLVETLSLPQVVAVVAHEAGHAKLNHLARYLVVALSLFLVWTAAIEVVLPYAGQAVQLGLMALFVALFWFGVLGWLSRRFERQADAFAADHAGALDADAPAVAIAGFEAPIPHGAALMIGVLRHLERVAGPTRHHRHAPPKERVAFLAAYATDPATREAFRKDSRRLALGLVGLVVLALAATAARAPLALARGEAKLLWVEGDEDMASADAARRRGDAAAATPSYRGARASYERIEDVLAKRPEDPEILRTAAAAALNRGELDLRRLGDPAAARAEYERAIALGKASKLHPAALVRFEANYGLGLLALREDDPASLSKASTHLEAAKAVPDAEYSGAKRRAQTRLLESAIRLRSADPAVAEAARRDLEAQGRAEGDAWEDLRDDAKAVLAAPVKR